MARKVYWCVCIALVWLWLGSLFIGVDCDMGQTVVDFGGGGQLSVLVALDRPPPCGRSWCVHVTLMLPSVTYLREHMWPRWHHLVVNNATVVFVPLWLPAALALMAGLVWVASDRIRQRSKGGQEQTRYRTSGGS